MIKLLPVSAALLLAVTASQASHAQGRGEHGPGKGKDAGERGQARNDNPGRGGDNPGKGGGEDKHARTSERADARPDQRAGRDDGHGRDQVAASGGERGRDRPEDRGRDRDHGPQIVVVPYRDYGVIRGCPPGLAKKDNGCLPPGQAKKIERARYDLRWGAPDGHVVRRYEDGYQYRYDPKGSLLGYLPALGGALAVGNPWPTQYRYDPAPVYQRDYFGLNQPYDYRYADGAIYGVDPKTAQIQQVVALLTGQSANVGQRMPSGYDIYNVPYAYRSQYADTANAAYRYNDGAVYQLDPKTQVIQAIIQLLT